MYYPITIQLDDGTYMITFPDIPEAATCGDTLDEALEMAADALVTAFEFYFEEQRTIPMPSKSNGEQIAVPLGVWLKVLLLNEMLKSGETQAGLAKKAGITRQEMQRVKSLRHNTKADTVERLMAALGKRLQVTVV